MTEDNILFVGDVAKLFRISPNTIRRRKWRERSGIPLRKVGKQLCGSRSDIERWFKKGLNG
jgi:hypothetical protein